MRATSSFVLLAIVLAGCAPLPPQTHEAIAEWKSGRADPDCEIPGDSSKWQADYCLAEMQTDDLVAAQPCMDRESRTRHGEECARRRHFKQEWCRRVVASGALQRSLAECIADPDQGGAIVKGLHLEQLAALALHPGFIEKLHWGAKIVGLRLQLAQVPEAVVAELIRQSWRAKAPKALQ